jgi:hypothetical protein
MQIQQTRPGGVAEAPAQLKLRGQASVQGKNKSRQPVAMDRHPNVARLERWALIGTAQQRIAHAQGGEQALGQVWGELKRLERQLSQTTSAGGEIVQRLRALEEKLTSQDAPLTDALKPRLLNGAGSRVHYGVDHLELLTAKPTAERLVLAFPVSNSAVEVLIPAGAQGQEVIKQLDQALHKEQIQARMSEQGKLELSLPEAQRRKLDEPVLISGEGIRIPAGNPVPVKFKQHPGQLSLLGEGLGRGEIKQEQRRLHKLLGEIEQSVRELKQFRQKMVQQLDKVKSRSQSLKLDELEQLQSKLSSQLKDGGFAGTMAGLLAQANVSRQNVVALLA